MHCGTSDCLDENPERGRTRRRMDHTRNIFNCPVSKAICWLLRDVPVTTGLVILLCVIHAVGGDIEDLRTKWGQEPQRPLSWVTHAFVHVDFWHIGGNLFYLVPSSALIELYLGRVQLAVIILYSVVTAAVMAGIAVPEYWETRCNPIGFSAVAYAVLALGTYMGVRIVTIQVLRMPVIRTQLEGLQNRSCPTIGTVAGMTAAGFWLVLSLLYEWNSEDSASRVAHSFGMISGVTMATFLAITAEGRKKARLGGPATVLAILAITAGGRKKARFGGPATVLAIAVFTIAILSVIPFPSSDALIICERPAVLSAINGEGASTLHPR